MTPDDIQQSLQARFGDTIQFLPPSSWQVETPDFRLLVLLSNDQSWVRVLLPLMPATEAQPFFEQLLEANFDQTQETRYAIHQSVLWVVFHHRLESLVVADFEAAIARLMLLQTQGLSDPFNRFVEDRVRQIITAAKKQGQSLEMTLQTLDRFYQEGLMGDLNQGEQAREDVLAAWRYQLERLWSQVEV